MHYASHDPQYRFSCLFLLNEKYSIYPRTRMSLERIIPILVWIGIFLTTVTIHEVAHGVVAFLRGDQTAKAMGRLTLNPFKHIDLFWTVLLPAILFISTGG